MSLCSGCFDGLHAGHVAYLRAAYALGRGREELVVVVADDEYIRRVKEREPVWSLYDRMRVIEELRCVSAVCIHGPQGVADIVHQLKPRLFVKGKDWAITSSWLQRFCASVGCELVIVDSGIQRHTADALPAHV